MDTSAVKSDSAMNSSPNQDVSIVASKGRVESVEPMVDRQDTQTKIKAKDIGDKERGSYNCSHCGVPKKGHVCPYQPKNKSKKRKKKKPPKRTHHDLIHIQHPTNNTSNFKKVRDKRVLSGGDTDADATMKKKAGTQKRPRTSKLPSTTESQKSVKDFLSKAVSSVVDTVASEICYCSSMFENAENKRRQANLDSNASSLSRRSTTPLDAPPPRQSHFDSQDMRRHEHNGESFTVAQLYNSSTVVGAVKRFVNDVYCPFLLSAQKRMGNHSPNVYRIQLSTLLAIREMLLMNANKLFTFSTLNQSSPKYSSERKYLSFVFVNAIVKNAARRLPCRDRDQEQVYSDFLQATRRYDSKSEDFQFALTRTDVLEVSEYRNGIQVGEQERSIHKVGFNYARSRHPLLATTETEGVRTDGGRMYGSTCPEPTACAAIYIETSNTDAEDTATLESFKRMLRKPPPSKRNSSECIDLT